MKRRTGFVSNSSTTSFLVTATHRDQLKVRVTKTIDLTPDPEEIIVSVEELDKRMGYIHEGVDFSQFESYVAARRSIEAGGIAVVVTVTDNYGDEEAELLCGMDPDYRAARLASELGIHYLEVD